MDIMEMNALDFLGLDYFEPEESFHSVVIVPTGNMHDSGYQSMKYVLAKGNEVVGCVGGISDVLHINGVGGMGREYAELVKPINWRIDCTPAGYVRPFASSELSIENADFSDVDVYAE